jgi:hypothetical protein
VAEKGKCAVGGAVRTSPSMYGDLHGGAIRISGGVIGKLGGSRLQGGVQRAAGGGWWVRTSTRKRFTGASHWQQREAAWMGQRRGTGLSSVHCEGVLFLGLHFERRDELGRVHLAAPEV